MWKLFPALASVTNGVDPAVASSSLTRGLPVELPMPEVPVTGCARLSHSTCLRARRQSWLIIYTPCAMSSVIMPATFAWPRGDVQRVLAVELYERCGII